MIDIEEIRIAARSQTSDDELRLIVDSELDDRKFIAHDMRLALAADLICESAMEILSQESEYPCIDKVVDLTRDEQMKLTDTAIFNDLQRAYRGKKVTTEELQALLLRSSVAGAISNALKDGASPEDIAGGSIRLVSFQLNKMLESEAKPKGILRRLFGKL